MASHTVWLRAFALASGIRFGFRRLVWTFGKALRMQEYTIVLGSCSFRESREKSGSTARSLSKSWRPEEAVEGFLLLLAREFS